MKADCYDAPPHLKRKRQNVGKWVIALSIGVAFITLAVYVTDHKIPFPSKPSLTQAPLAESYTPKYELNDPNGHPATTPARLFWDDVNERNRQQTRPKQTVYNDTKYVPKRATNVVDMEDVRQSQAYRRPTANLSRSPAIISSNPVRADKWGGGPHYDTEWVVSLITLTTLRYVPITNVDQLTTAKAGTTLLLSSKPLPPYWLTD